MESVLSPLLSLVIATLVLAVVLFVFTTVVLVLFIYYWNKPSIKATSPSLSIFILVGCYILYIGCLIIGVREFIDYEHFGSLCQAQLWFCVIGVQMIYSTLFMRPLRIYCFFFVFKRAGGCPVVVAQWQSTGCTNQVSWVPFPAAASLFTFLYFCLLTSKFSLFQQEAKVLSKESWYFYVCLSQGKESKQRVGTFTFAYHKGKSPRREPVLHGTAKP